MDFSDFSIFFVSLLLRGDELADKVIFSPFGLDTRQVSL